MIKETIIKTLGGFAVKFDGETVDMLTKRVQDATLKKQPGKTFNPTGLAFTVARNWAISEQRRIAAESRRQAAALLAEDLARKEQALYERCLEEFDRISFELLPKLRSSQPRQLQLVRLIAFGNLTQEQCAAAFPDTSREQRFKWKTRGYKLVLRHASIELTDYLREFITERSEHKH